MVILSKTSHKMNLFLWKKRICAVQPTLAITGATQGTSHDKIYQKLRLESLKLRRCYKHLVCVFKVMNEKAHNYLINLIPKYEHTVRTRKNSITSCKCRTNCFKHFNLDILRNSKSISLFKCRLLSFIGPVQNNINNI